MIIRAVIVFAVVVTLLPREPGKAAEAAPPVSGVLTSMQSAMLTDIAQVKADIAQSQRERGDSLLDRI